METVQIGCIRIKGSIVIGDIYKVEGEDRYEYLLAFVRDDDTDDNEEYWDSNVETYNGVQRLTEEQARAACYDALCAIENGEGGEYFDSLKGG